MAARRPLALALVAGMLAGCQWLPRPATAPLAVERTATTCSAPGLARADTLLVLLPGVYSDIGEFRSEGYVQAVADARIAADTVAVDLHRGYFENRSAVERLQADVIAPARAAGYRRIWLVGVSLGGFGALLNEVDRPGTVDGIVLVAPYLGEPNQIASVAAVGLQGWQPPVGGHQDQAGAVNAVWALLQRQGGASASPPVWLGYGTEDRFAAAHRLLAGHLPRDHVASTPGGHDWTAWRAVWRQLLPRLPLPRCTSP